MVRSRVAVAVPLAVWTLALAACAGKTSPARDAELTPAPSDVTVTVTPGYARVTVNASRAFDAAVSGTTVQTVTWTVDPAGCGTVVSTGAHTALFTAPPAPATCLVRAACARDATITGFATAEATPASSGGVCGAAPGQLFPSDAPWNTPVDEAPLDWQSDEIIQYLSRNHGAGGRFQIGFDFNVLYATSTVARRPFTPNADFYEGDCDPAPIPVPPGGRLESRSTYACGNGDDCHLTVIDEGRCRLWEMWRAHIPNGLYDGPGFEGGCLAIWDLAHTPPPTMRGDFCTSADGAGLPILPLVFSADEVAAGHIDHAIRFILPNDLIRHFVYVRPGTHSTGPTGGGADAPPYAVRVRLKAGKDLSTLTAGARVVAEALKRYGMILADGGTITFTATDDGLTAHKWADVGLGPHDLMGLAWTDFEVVQLGDRLDYGAGSCNRTPITD